MNEDERKNHCYLGDGVYGEWDGQGIILRTADHREDRCQDKIYMEIFVLESLNLFYQKILAQLKEKE